MLMDMDVQAGHLHGYCSRCGRTTNVIRQQRKSGTEYTLEVDDHFGYEEANDCLHCPQGQVLRHTTTSKDGKRIYRSTPKVCRNCPCREQCGASAKGQKVMQRHIWQEAMDLAEQLRKTELGKDLYAMRKQTIERVFADAKEKHAMRYTHHRGLARVTRWVTLKFAAMNLKKLAVRTWQHSFPPCFSRLFLLFSCSYKRRRRFA